MVLPKHQLEASLHEEHKLIQTGKLRDENPFDDSEAFQQLCLATRNDDLKGCQEAINAGANINGRDSFDYTPLILASLCGHYEVAQLLLESGALCERDTFSGERCIYSALNDRMRNLLLSYDFSKSTDPLQPLLVILLLYLDGLHKFILAARCPYFRKKLVNAPETTTFRLPATIPPQAFSTVLRYIYLSELPRDVGGGPGTGYSEKEVLDGIDKLSAQLELGNLMEDIIGMVNRRQARQKRASDIELGRAQLETWFRENVLRYKVLVDTEKAQDVKWVKNNAIFADILLRADEEPEDYLEDEGQLPEGETATHTVNGIPIGPMSNSGAPEIDSQPRRKSVLFPVHRAMLLRSDYFSSMFSSGLLESQEKPHLHIVKVDCAPEILEWILLFLYAEKTDFPLELALDILVAADALFVERLKSKAALIITTLGSGTLNQEREKLDNGVSTTSAILAQDVLDPFEIMRAAWELRVPRLETFVARYLAFRLEQYIDLPDFADLIKESAARIQNREETDTVEIVDDIRHYLSERFRLRFDGDGLAELLDDEYPEDEIPADLSDGKAVNGSADPSSDVPAKNATEQHPEQNNLEPLEASHNGAAKELVEQHVLGGAIRTLDGELVSDEFESDAQNYRILLDKIELLLEKLDLEA